MTKPEYNQESRNLKLAVLAERDNVKELLDFFEYCLDDPDGSQRTYLGPRGIVCRFKASATQSMKQRDPDPILILGIRFTKPLYW